MLNWVTIQSASILFIFGVTLRDTMVETHDPLALFLLLRSLCSLTFQKKVTSWTSALFKLTICIST